MRVILNKLIILKRYLGSLFHDSFLYLLQTLSYFSCFFTSKCAGHQEMGAVTLDFQLYLPIISPHRNTSRFKIIFLLNLIQPVCSSFVFFCNFYLSALGYFCLDTYSVFSGFFSSAFRAHFKLVVLNSGPRDRLSCLF